MTNHKPAHTPFVDETGDDYGLGAGVCEEAPDGSPSADAYADVENYQRSPETPVLARCGADTRATVAILKT
jgi:hypothetical protein